MSAIIFQLVKRDGGDASGLTPTVTTDADGTGLGAAGGTITERGSGSYAYTPSAGELAAANLAIRISEATCISQIRNYRQLTRNTASQFFYFQAINDTDGSDSSQTVTAQVSADGGAFGAAGGTLTNAGNGAWRYAPTQAETDNDALAAQFTGTDVVPGVINALPETPITEPAVTDVRAGVQYGPGDTKTGTLVIPAVTDVRLGTEYDVAPTAKTGTLVIPAEKDVRKGTAYDVAPQAKEGNLVLPAVNQVLAGINFGNDDPASEFTGTRTDCADDEAIVGASYGDPGAPTAGRWSVANLTPNNVRDAITYGVDGLQVGTLDPGAGTTPLFPLESEVLDGVQFGPDDAAPSFTGNRTDCPVAAALVGANYGAGGIGLSGTWDASNLSPDNILDGVAWGADGAQTGRVTLPADTQVLLGVAYGGVLANNYTGRWDVANVTTANVRAGITFGIDSAQTGGVIIPAVTDVRSGTAYDVAPTAKTGTLAVPTPGRVIDGVATDNTVGTFVYPLEAQVLLDTNYGAGGTEFVGSLDPGAGGVVPSAGDVRFGIPVGDTTGTLVLPLEEQVLLGVGFGTDGTEFTGTLDATTYPTVTFIAREAAGGAVPGVSVRIVETDETKTTTSDGVVVFNLQTGNYTYEVTAPAGYQAVPGGSFSVLPDIDQVIDLVMTPTAVPGMAWIDCNLLINGRPVEDAEITATLAEKNSHVSDGAAMATPTRDRIHTDAAGYAALHLYEAGAFSRGTGSYQIEGRYEGKVLFSVVTTVPEGDRIDLADLIDAADPQPIPSLPQPAGA